MPERAGTPHLSKLCSQRLVGSHMYLHILDPKKNPTLQNINLILSFRFQALAKQSTATVKNHKILDELSHPKHWVNLLSKHLSSLFISSAIEDMIKFHMP
jgi:hypothetical protein